MKHTKLIVLFLSVVIATICFTGCKASVAGKTPADAGNGEKESVTSITESTADEPKVYTSFTAEAYNETSLSDGVEPLENLSYDAIKKTEKMYSGNEGISPTIIKTVFDKEEVFEVSSYRIYNEYLKHNVGVFSSDNFRVYIDMQTDELLMVWNKKYSESYEEGKEKATEEEFISKATQYIYDLTGVDVSSYSKVYTPGNMVDYSGKDLGYTVTFVDSETKDTAFWKYIVKMDYTGVFTTINVNPYNNCEAIRDFTDEAMSEARKAAQAKYEAVCKDNGIDPKKAEIISTELVYLEEEQCPVINVRYKHNDKTVQNNGFIMISVKAK